MLDIKYGRMFAEGMRGLIQFFQNGLKTDKTEISDAYHNFPPNELLFDTNLQMQNFTIKLIGEKYFDKTKRIIRLKTLAKDAEENPEVLEKIKKISDPERLSQHRAY